MSGIYIPGMETPKGMGVNVTTVFDAQINVYGDGTASIDVKSSHDSPMVRFSLIPVPEHGRLGDLDDVINDVRHYLCEGCGDYFGLDAKTESCDYCGVMKLIKAIERKPSIIQADKEVVPSDR